MKNIKWWWFCGFIFLVGCNHKRHISSFSEADLIKEYSSTKTQERLNDLFCTMEPFTNHVGMGPEVAIDFPLAGANATDVYYLPANEEFPSHFYLFNTNEHWSIIIVKPCSSSLDEIDGYVPVVDYVFLEK